MWHCQYFLQRKSDLYSIHAKITRQSGQEHLKDARRRDYRYGGGYRKEVCQGCKYFLQRVSDLYSYTLRSPGSLDRNISNYKMLGDEITDMEVPIWNAVSPYKKIRRRGHGKFMHAFLWSFFMYFPTLLIYPISSYGRETKLPAPHLQLTSKYRRKALLIRDNPRFVLPYLEIT